MKYVVLGFPSTDLEQVKEAVEEALGIEMVPHDSLYWGEYYLWEGPGSDEIKLVLNEEPMDGEPFEQEHHHLGAIIYASLSDTTSNLTYDALSSIPTSQLVRHEEV